MTNLEKKMQKMTPEQRKRALDSIGSMGCGGKKPARSMGKKKAGKK